MLSYHVALSATHGMRPSVSRAPLSQPARIPNPPGRERVAASGIWYHILAASAAMWPAKLVTKVLRLVSSPSSRYSPLAAASRGVANTVAEL